MLLPGIRGFTYRIFIFKNIKADYSILMENFQVKYFLFCLKFLFALPITASCNSRKYTVHGTYVNES